MRWARECPSALDPDLPADLVRSHIDQAYRLVEELEQRCPSFRDRPHALDCTDVPCILGIDVPNVLPVDFETVCGSAILDDLDVVTHQTHRNQRCAPTALIPLWDLADLAASAPVVEERFYARRGFRNTEACQAVEALRSAE